LIFTRFPEASTNHRKAIDQVPELPIIGATLVIIAF
jgi:hypothetical protein